MAPRTQCRTMPDLRARVAQAAEVFRKRRTTGSCIAPLSDGSECGEPSIASHLVANSAHLKTIAVDGHVMAMNNDVMQQSLRVRPVGKISVNKVSTFRGFCPAHDGSLFRDIDTADFPFNDKTAFLLSYRALARELVARRRSLLASQEALAMPQPDEMLARLDSVVDPVTRSALLGWRDLEQSKLGMDQALLTDDFARVRWAAWSTDRPPEVVASSHVCPDRDFQFSPLQSAMSEQPGFYVAASILPHSNAGLLHLAWYPLADAPNCWHRLVKSLSAEGDGANNFLIWLMGLSESVFWSEPWWNQLAERTKQAVLDLLYESRIDKDVRLVDWRLRKRHGEAKAASRRWPPPWGRKPNRQ